MAKTNSVSTVVRIGGPGWERIAGKVKKVSSQGGMPPLAKDVVDEAGVAKLQAFIATQ